MEKNDIKALSKEGFFENRKINGLLQETHISWVILSGKDAFKIKKPVKLSFLDFSNLSLRKKYCKKELFLNARFTDIYLDVLPVRLAGNHFILGSEKGKIIDYAVHMKRMDAAKKMDVLLRQGKVDEVDMMRLARTIAEFHLKARPVKTPFNVESSRHIFNDITEIKDLVKQHFRDDYQDLITEAVHWSDHFLRTHQRRLQERIAHGFKRDVHGDLHSANIFLYKNPVVFDCIEFNDQYRQIDVLFEIAFLCMDLEAFKKDRLCHSFLINYRRIFRCLETEEDEQIFEYFKSVRANIRAKVHAASAMQATNHTELQHHLDEVKKYLDLMRLYIERETAWEEI